MTLALDDLTVDMLADALATRITVPDGFPHDGYATTDQVATYLQVGRDWVYKHQTFLGGHKFRGALRFDAGTVRDWARRQRLSPAQARAREDSFPFEVLTADTVAA